MVRWLLVVFEEVGDSVGKPLTIVVDEVTVS